MKLPRGFYIFFFLLIPLSGYGAEVHEYSLKNGLKVIIVEEHKAPVATFQVWYRVGSKDEPAGKSGMSHLLEHMMFKGTAEYGPSEFSKIVQKNGGTDNAYTTKDYTTYFEIFSSERVMLSLDLEKDRMQNLTLDPKETFSERNVVMEERRLNYEDDPESSLFEEVVAMAFKSHPYQRPVIGWMSDLRSIDREDLYDYYKTYYSPANAVIVVAGDVNPAEMIEKIRTSFGVIPPGPSKNRITTAESEQRGERRLLHKKEAKLPHVIAAFHTPSFPHEDSYALEVLSLIFSNGKSSRLYRSLVYEKKLSLDASAYYDSLNKDPYLFFFSSTSAPGRDIKDVEEAIYAEIERLKKAPPSEEEVQKAKNQIESSFIMDQDSIFMQAMKYGTFEMLGDWRLIDSYLEGIKKVTPADVARVVRKYLKEDNRTVGILLPTDERQANGEKKNF
ncbi:MAG: pitrilysin family protein [Nitrospirota bacterium]